MLKKILSIFSSTLVVASLTTAPAFAINTAYKGVPGAPTSVSDCVTNGFASFTNLHFTSDADCENWVNARMSGVLTLADPHQIIRFNLGNPTTSKPDNKKNGVVDDAKSALMNTVTYANFEFNNKRDCTGKIHFGCSAFHYHANVICTNIDPNTQSARFIFQIPSSNSTTKNSGLAGLYVLAQVQVNPSVGEDSQTSTTYGHTATDNEEDAINWCINGQNFTVQNYPVVGGNAVFEEEPDLVT